MTPVRLTIDHVVAPARSQAASAESLRHELQRELTRAVDSRASWAAPSTEGSAVSVDLPPADGRPFAVRVAAAVLSAFDGR